MCNHARSLSPTLRRPTFYYSPGRVSPEPSLESTNSSFHGEEEDDEESARIKPQHHGSFVDDDDNDSLVTRVTSHVANKRARSYCFLGLLEHGNVTDQVDLLSTQFSLMSPPKVTTIAGATTTRGNDIVTDCESIEEDSSPRKRHCRGLIRSPRSSQLHSLGSLSD